MLLLITKIEPTLLEQQAFQVRNFLARMGNPPSAEFQMFDRSRPREILARLLEFQPGIRLALRDLQILSRDSFADELAIARAGFRDPRVSSAVSSTDPVVVRLSRAQFNALCQAPANGLYIPGTNICVVVDTAEPKTIIHEIGHFLFSLTHDQDHVLISNPKLKSPLEVVSLPHWLIEGLNEWGTITATERSISYPLECLTPLILEFVVGRQVLDSARATGDLREVQRILEERTGQQGLLERVLRSGDGAEAYLLLSRAVLGPVVRRVEFESDARVRSCMRNVLLGGLGARHRDLWPLVQMRRFIPTPSRVAGTLNEEVASAIQNIVSGDLHSLSPDMKPGRGFGDPRNLGSALARALAILQLDPSRTVDSAALEAVAAQRPDLAIDSVIRRRESEQGREPLDAHTRGLISNICLPHREWLPEEGLRRFNEARAVLDAFYTDRSRALGVSALQSFCNSFGLSFDPAQAASIAEAAVHADNGTLNEDGVRRMCIELLYRQRGAQIMQRMREHLQALGINVDLSRFFNPQTLGQTGTGFADAHAALMLYVSDILLADRDLALRARSQSVFQRRVGNLRILSDDLTNLVLNGGMIVRGPLRARFDSALGVLIVEDTRNQTAISFRFAQGRLTYVSEALGFHNTSDTRQSIALRQEQGPEGAAARASRLISRDQVMDLFAEGVRRRLFDELGLGQWFGREVTDRI